jgi:hypothetical protein
MSLSNTSTTTGARVSAAAQATKHDLCNILAAKVGTYLKPRKNFLMYVVVTDYDDIDAYPDGEICQRLVCGFSHRTI